MAVEVHYFAVLRERRGRERESVPLLGAESVQALYLRLFPPSREGSLPVMFAVNHVYVPASHPLRDGDEVAFIPPLGGG